MTAVEAYLSRVSRGMAGMDPRVREDVLKELRSHLRDASVEAGEERAVAQAEAPDPVARRYKRLYGYGKAYRAIFIFLGGALAVLTLPILLYGDVVPGTASLVAVAALVGLIAYVMWVAVSAGSTTGLSVGLVACGSRFATLAVVGAVAGAVVPDATGWISFTATSLLLIVIGFVPGAAKERWQPRDVTL